MIGGRLGKWVIFRELGRGGMGQVYLAQEELSGRQAALKILAAELAQEEGFLQRFQREIDALSKLDHPGIVRFYESGHDNSMHYYAMEYVEGQSLDRVLLERGRLPWTEVLDIALQICPALRHVHDHGIIHRDLKPPNIMRTAQGAIKLTDFGIAKVFGGQHQTATGTVVGTADFLSPEQASGKPVSKRSDLYSLGIVLYALLTGRTPFEGNSFVDLLHKHRYGQFDPPRRLVPEIPYEIDAVVCQLLEKEPDKRPPDCRVLAKQLDSIRRKLERTSRPTELGEATEFTIAENKAPIGAEDRAGPATLMSALMRAELDRQNLANPLSRLLNRAWVLVPLLLLCVGAIAWAFWPLSMDELYARGAQGMASERLADMREAWREYLEPLSTRFPDNPYRAELDKFRRKLLAAEGAGLSEAQRFFLRGESLRQAGDIQGARRVWQAVIAAFQKVDREKEWVDRAERGLADLKKSAASADRWESIKPALAEAAALRDHGQRAEAEKIWGAIEDLYRDDPWAEPLLKEVAKARQK